MTTFADDAVAEMLTDMHTDFGATVSIHRGGSLLGSVTMSMHRQPSQYVDNGSGGITEVLPIDFIAKTSDLPSDPRKGDRITAAGLFFEVQPTTSEKVYRRINDSMTRIHTKQVAK